MYICDRPLFSFTRGDGFSLRTGLTRDRDALELEVTLFNILDVSIDLDDGAIRLLLQGERADFFSKSGISSLSWSLIVFLVALYVTFDISRLCLHLLVLLPISR